MQWRNLGNSGLSVSSVGLGCNNFGRSLDFEAASAVVGKALDLGVTLFDCADVYGQRGGAEIMLGRALGPRRKEVVLVTKFGKKMDADGRLAGGSRRYILQAVEASLTRLGTDWIDLYQMHDPDPLVPIEETLRALEELVRQGKVRYIGCSHYEAWRLADAQWTSRTHGLARFVACEEEYSLLARGIESELFPAMRAHGVGLLPYYPLASGMLTGKYSVDQSLPAGSRMARAERDYAGKFFTETNWRRVQAFSKFAQSRGHSLLALAVSWLIANPIVGGVIAGATAPWQVEANVGAASWRLTNEDLAEIERLSLLSDID
jgi:aryl-alcohol dehydrogenase-like predicted oxidoreductase